MLDVNILVVKKWINIITLTKLLSLIMFPENNESSSNHIYYNVMGLGVFRNEIPVSQ